MSNLILLNYYLEDSNIINLIKRCNNNIITPRPPLLRSRTQDAELNLNSNSFEVQFLQSETAGHRIGEIITKPDSESYIMGILLSSNANINFRNLYGRYIVTGDTTEVFLDRTINQLETKAVIFPKIRFENFENFVISPMMYFSVNSSGSATHTLNIELGIPSTHELYSINNTHILERSLVDFFYQRETNSDIKFFLIPLNWTLGNGRHAGLLVCEYINESLINIYRFEPHGGLSASTNSYHLGLDNILQEVITEVNTRNRNSVLTYIGASNMNSPFYDLTLQRGNFDSFCNAWSIYIGFILALNIRPGDDMATISSVINNRILIPLSSLPDNGQLHHIWKFILYIIEIKFRRSYTSII